MSNPNKTEINRRYGDAIKASMSNFIFNSPYGLAGVSFNGVGGTSTDVSHAYNGNTTTIDTTVKAINNNIEHLYPKTIVCDPQYLTVEIKKEMVTMMNAATKIKDVEIIIPNKVVKVTFNDNTFEKAVCHEDDEFNLETAIMICITKHLLGGSSKFNKLIAKGVKIIEDKIKAEKEAEKEKVRIEAKRLKNHNKRVERRKRKEADARKARIQETAEAIKLAYNMMNNESNIEEEK